MSEPPAQPAQSSVEPAAEAPASLYARGDFGALRKLPQQAVSEHQRAAIAVDRVHAAVLAACALGLILIAAHYGGAAP